LRFSNRVNAVLVAPGATKLELLLGYGAAVVGALLGAVCGLAENYSVLQVTVLAVLGFDIIGGVVVNATVAAQKRFGERPGWRRRSITFVAMHVHPFVLTAAYAANSWWSAALLYAGLVASAALITQTSPMLRRPAAFACTAGLIVLSSATGPTGVSLAWVLPLLVIKLLLAHMLAGSSTRYNLASKDVELPSCRAVRRV